MLHREHNLIGERLRAAHDAGRSALIAFCVAGHPTRREFGSTLRSIALQADLIEIGLPFSDPVADGPVIASISRERAYEGITLDWLFQCIGELPEPLSAPPILFSYFNPILAYGMQRVLQDMARLGFAGLVVPDLPLEESEELREEAQLRGLDLVQLVTPLSSPVRCRRLAQASRGFLYAVLRTGVTGTRSEVEPAVQFLRRIRSIAELPVCAGFGLSDAHQMQALRHEADGLIVGTALVEHIERGLSPEAFLKPFFQATRFSRS